MVSCGPLLKHSLFLNSGVLVHFRLLHCSNHLRSVSNWSSNRNVYVRMVSVSVISSNLRIDRTAMAPGILTGPSIAGGGWLPIFFRSESIIDTVAPFSSHPRSKWRKQLSGPPDLCRSFSDCGWSCRDVRKMACHEKFVHKILI